MPGGIGPVSDATLSACTGQDRTFTSKKNANEIFFNLDQRRVLYDGVEGYLYFVDATNGIVSQTLQAALSGLGRPPSVEQIYLDPHKFFSGARRVRLTPTDADTLLVALRLAGVRTTVRHAPARSSNTVSPG